MPTKIHIKTFNVNELDPSWLVFLCLETIPPHSMFHQMFRMINNIAWISAICLILSMFIINSIITPCFINSKDKITKRYDSLVVKILAFCSKTPLNSNEQRKVIQCTKFKEVIITGVSGWFETFLRKFAWGVNGVKTMTFQNVFFQQQKIIWSYQSRSNKKGHISKFSKPWCQI